MSSETRYLSGVPKHFANGYSWEMDIDGCHRIVGPDGVGGSWAAYQSIAISHDGKFGCVSQYFGCLREQAVNSIPGDILAEELFEIRYVAGPA